MSRTFLWLTRLRLQIRIGLLVILGLTFIFAFMAWEGMQTMDAAIQLTLQERLALARTVAMHLDQDLERTLNRLTQVAAFPTINLEDGDVEPEKAELRGLYRPEVFSYVFLLDKDRRVIWTEPYLPQVVGSQHAECPHMQEILRTGQPAIVPAPHTLTPQTPVVAPIVPIKNKAGTVIGLLGAGINPSSQLFSDRLRPIVASQTRYAQLVDEDGNVLAHTQGRNLFQRSEHADLLVPLLREKRAAIETHTVTEEGKGTIREVIAFAPLSQVPWGVTLEQVEAELLAPVIELRARILFFAAVAFAGALLLVWVTTRSVIQPVNKLMAVSKRIAAGDLTTPVPPLGEDEIGELGQHFEAMRGKLAVWGEELEAAVQKRTRELSILYAIDRAAAQSLDLDKILNDSLDKVLEVLEIEAGGIYLLESDEETLTLCAHRGVPAEFVENVQRVKLGEGVSGRAAAAKKPVVLDVAREAYPTERLAPYVIREGFETLTSTPLLSAGKLIGALNLATRRARAFPPEELELLTAIGQQLGGAAQNARLFQETRVRAQQLGLLYDAGLTINRELDPRVQLEFLCKIAMTAVHADRAEFFRFDAAGNQMRFEISIGYSEEIQKTLPGLIFPLGEARGLVGWVAQNRLPLYLPDVAADPRWMTIDPEIRAALWVPVVHEKELLGTLGVFSARVNAFAPHDERLLISFANQVAVAMENARLYTQTQQNLTRIRNLYELSTEILATTTTEETARVVVQQVVRAAGAHSAMLNLLEPDGRCTLRIGMDPQGLPSPEPPPRPDGTTMEIFRTGEPLIVADVAERRAPMIPRLVEMGIKAFIGLPLKVGARVIGVLFVRFTESRAFSADATLREALAIFANQAAMALEKARLYQGLEESKAALEAKVRDLERFTRLAVGRELRMKELKERVRELEEQES